MSTPPDPPPVDLILVPQGAEYQAVERGLRPIPPPQRPRLVALAVGYEAVIQRLGDPALQTVLESCRHGLVMGLAGSLSPQLGVGEVVVYQEIRVLRSAASVSRLAVTLAAHEPDLDAPDYAPFGCDHGYSASLLQRLPQARSVIALSSDRLVHQGHEKLSLGQQSGAAVVDMEAIALHQLLHHRGDRPPLTLGTVRVISDDCATTLPNLSPAFKADGSLDGWVLAGTLVQNPIAAFNLIRGSLRALATLEKVTTQLLT
ncbi:phosphorylase family protein [Prochlorothrix hollandica]|nr:hypothetical protein [Prochlorothrix hollandica]